jgi:hypothetical protein
MRICRLCAVAATLICANALAGPAKGTTECEGVKHAVKTAIAIWVPEKLQFQVMLFTEQLSDADQALAARIAGESMLGRVPKGFSMQTADEGKKRMEFSDKRAVLMRGYLKAAADTVETDNLRGAFLVSVNCGPNKSFNQSMHPGDKNPMADVKKQFTTLAIPLKKDAAVKLATAKYSQKPDPKTKTGSRMTASWQFQGEAKMHVFE